MGPETACETSGPITSLDRAAYETKARAEQAQWFDQGAPTNRVYPATVDELRARRSQLRERQRLMSQKIEVLNSLIALWED